MALDKEFFLKGAGLAALLVLGFVSPATAESTKNIGTAVTVTGTATVVRGTTKQPLKGGDPVLEHDILETGGDGKIAVTFTDKTSFAVGPNSQIAVDTYFFDPKNLKGNMLAEIKKGTMMVRTGQLTKQNPGSVRIKTPRTVLGVRGTTFVVSVDP